MNKNFDQTKDVNTKKVTTPRRHNLIDRIIERPPLRWVFSLILLVMTVGFLFGLEQSIQEKTRIQSLISVDAQVINAYRSTNGPVAKIHYHVGQREFQKTINLSSGIQENPALRGSALISKIIKDKRLVIYLNPSFPKEVRTHLRTQVKTALLGLSFIVTCAVYFLWRLVKYQRELKEEKR